MTIDLCRVVAGCGLAVLVGNVAAAAQDLAESTSVVRRTLEVGVITSIVPPLQTPGIGARIAISADGPVAFEVEAEWMDAGRHLYLSDQIVWHYVLQAVHELRASGHGRPKIFATYGISGWAERNATRSGLRTLFIPPFMPTVGAGAQWRVASHVAVRIDGQVIMFFGEGFFVAPRLTVGATVPIRFGRPSSS